MAVQQTECYRVVTIGYLKDFIGTLIQDSSNGSVKYVNLNALSAEKRRDDYCPTYSELTANSLVQTWNPGSTSNGDRDGIVVNSSAILGGNYADNQLVDQRDLSLMYTRLNTFSIAASPTGVSACANDSIISYTHTYNRNSKYMNSSCVIVSGGDTAVTDTNDSEVELTANYSSTFDGWSNHTKRLHIPKNSSSTGQAPERYITVTGQIVFRGATGTTTTVITQSALTASWEYVSTSYDMAVGRIEPSDGYRGCAGGTYSASGEGYTYTSYVLRDSCGAEYDRTTTTSTSSLGTSGGSFGSLDCCNGDQTVPVDVSFSFAGQTKSVNFVQSCSSCAPCTPPEPDPPTPGPEPEPEPQGPDEYPKYPNDDYTTYNNEIRGTDNGTDVCIDRVTGAWYVHYAPLIAVDDDGFPQTSGTDSDSVYITGPLYYCYNGDCNDKRILGSDWVDFGHVQIRRVMYDDDHNPTGFAFDSRGNRIAGLEIKYNYPPQDTWYKFEIRMSAQSGGEVMYPYDSDGNPKYPWYGRTATEWNWCYWIPPRNCEVNTCYPCSSYTKPGDCDCGGNREGHSGWAHCY